MNKMITWAVGVFFGSVLLIGCAPVLEEGVVLPVVYNAPAEGLFEAKVGIQCSRGPNGELVVDLKPNHRARGVAVVSFGVEGEEYGRWLIRPDAFETIDHVVYGELPEGAVQIHPEGDVPPAPLPREGIIRVRVAYGYDSMFPPAAAMGHRGMRIELVGDDQVRYFGETAGGPTFRWSVDDED